MIAPRFRVLKISDLQNGRELYRRRRIRRTVKRFRERLATIHYALNWAVKDISVISSRRYRAVDVVTLLDAQLIYSQSRYCCESTYRESIDFGNEEESESALQSEQGNPDTALQVLSHAGERAYRRAVSIARQHHHRAASGRCVKTGASW